MSNLWTDQVVVFHPLFNKDNSLQGFAIVSKNHKVFVHFKREFTII